MKLVSASADNNFSDLDYPGETSSNFLFAPEKIMVLQSAVSRSNVVPGTIKQTFMRTTAGNSKKEAFLLS